MKIRVNQIYFILICILSVATIVLKALGYDYLIILLTFIIFLFMLLNYKRLIPIISRQVGLIAFGVLLICSTLINQFFNSGHLSGVINDLLLLLFIVLGCYSGKYFVEWDKNDSKILKFHYILMMIAVIYAVGEFIFKSNPLLPFFYVDNLTIPNGYRVASVFVHPVTCGVFMLIAYWFNIFSKLNIKFKVIGTVLSIVAIYATGSRSTWIAFIVTNILFILKHFSINIKKNYIYLTIVTINTIIIFLYSSQGQKILDSIIARFLSVNGSYSSTQRLGSWIYIIDEYMNNSNIFQILFGHGYKAAFDTMLKTTISIPGFFSTDNTYISALYNYGIVSVGIILFLIILVIKSYFLSSNLIYEMLSLIIIGNSIACLFFECNFFLNISFYIYFYIGVWLYGKIYFKNINRYNIK